MLYFISSVFVHSH